MTNKEAIYDIKKSLKVDGSSGEIVMIKPLQPQTIDMAIKALEFTEWVAKEIFDEEWEYNKDSFEELACRKLEKIGIVRKSDTDWVLVESEVEE